MGSGGAVAFATALKSNRALRTLSLNSAIFVSNVFCILILTFVSFCQTDTTCEFEGFAALSDMLASNNTLTSLDLGGTLTNVDCSFAAA
jgi:hypothetical protein